MLHGETIHSALPQDIPWWMPDHAIFFGVLYAVLIVLCCGLGLVFMKSLRETHCEASGSGGHGAHGSDHKKTGHAAH